MAVDGLGLETVGNVRQPPAWVTWSAMKSIPSAACSGPTQIGQGGQRTSEPSDGACHRS
jgi:hypothetical protein